MSLHARLERDLAKGKIHYANIEGSNISTESEEGYLENVEIHGNTWQNAENLADIRSVGTKVEGQELYEIPVVSCGKNLININDIVVNEGVNTSTGNFGVDTTRSRTPYIRFNPNVDYVATNVDAVFFYDKNKQFISVNRASKGTSPSNCNYVVVRMLNTTTNWQLEEGTQATSYEPYQEDKLTILSPVQLEKVGDVADRIVCKDGVYGVEKNIVTERLVGSLFTANYAPGTNDTIVGVLGQFNKSIEMSYAPICDCIKGKANPITGGVEESISILNNQYIYLLLNKQKASDIRTVKQWLESNVVMFKYITKIPQFIPLPHDQQIKLRTFADRTHISFDTEIEPTLKAQVPKSLGATVNTHTTQIDNLNKELDRVKKLEESTVTTVTTDSSFTTIAETNGGYFEDVKLEGKTEKNLLVLSELLASDRDGYLADAHKLTLKLKPNTEYTLFGEHPQSPDNTVVYFNGVSTADNGVYINKPNCQITDSEGCVYIALVKGRTYYNEIANGTYKLLLKEGNYTEQLPCFEGLKSVGQDSDEISVSSVNENLCPIEEFTGVVVYNSDVTNTVNKVMYKNILLSKNQDYIFNCEDKTNTSVVFYHNDPIPDNYDNHSNLYVYLVMGNRGIQIRNGDISGKGYKYATITTGGGFSNHLASINETIIYKNMSLKAVVSNTTYKPHQSNKKQILYYNPTTQTWEKPVLREWDSIEKHSDGKYYYHKRSGEVVLNGSEVISKQSMSTNSDVNTTRFRIKINTSTFINDSINIINDKFANVLNANAQYITDSESINLTYNTSDLDQINIRISNSKLSSQDVQGFKQWLQANPVTVVYQLAKEEVYECTNLDLITYNGEINLIVNSGAIQPKLELKVLSNVSNVVKLLQEKVSVLENKFINGLKQVLAGDMMSLAHLLYPEDFENSHEIQTLEL